MHAQLQIVFNNIYIYPHTEWFKTTNQRDRKKVVTRTDERCHGTLHTSSKSHNCSKDVWDTTLYTKRSSTGEGHPTVLTAAEEAKTEETCLLFAEWGFGIG